MDNPPHQSGTGRDVTALLLAWRQGNQSAFEELLPLVYDELRRMAHRQLRGERQHTIQTADLVHETYFRLVDSSRVQWQNRAHFFAVAAQSMRRILVDAARARRSLKRGGDLTRVEMAPELTIGESPNVDLVALDDALTALARVDDRRACVVELRFFGGLTVEEAASAGGVARDRHAGLEGREGVAVQATESPDQPSLRCSPADG